jgi:hypothetical protein
MYIEEDKKLYTKTKRLKYQKYISDLKKKLKIGIEVKWSKYYGPIIKVTDIRVYFKDENTSRIFWCLIDIVELY